MIYFLCALFFFLIVLTYSKHSCNDPCIAAGRSCKTRNCFGQSDWVIPHLFNLGKYNLYLLCSSTSPCSLVLNHEPLLICNCLLTSHYVLPKISLAMLCGKPRLSTSDSFTDDLPRIYCCFAHLNLFFFHITGVDAMMDDNTFHNFLCLQYCFSFGC